MLHRVRVSVHLHLHKHRYNTIIIWLFIESVFACVYVNNICAFPRRRCRYANFKFRRYATCPTHTHTQNTRIHPLICYSVADLFRRRAQIFALLLLLSSVFLLLLFFYSFIQKFEMIRANSEFFLLAWPFSLHNSGELATGSRRVPIPWSRLMSFMAT